MNMLPLRVVKAISGHMCQRQMVGEGQLFKKFVIGLPQPNENKTQALEMTMRTRAKRMEDFAIDIESEITTELLLKGSTIRGSFESTS